MRGVTLNLVGHTRALELCAGMNRETEVLDFIDRIEPGEVFYDLGACEGRFALYAALRGIRCYAFEPESMNFSALQENFALNRIRVEHLLTPLKYAVGEANHQSTIKIGQPWAGGHHRVLSDVSSRVDLDFNFVSEQPVEVVALDAFIDNMNLPAPNYMKIDVDGSELAFLKGAQQTLASRSLKAIIFELLERDVSYQEAIALLEALGFGVVEKHEVEPGLFNVVFKRSGVS
ncbi:MAG: FkbM family methyltransferase [Pyrinomonadaceae bacterium]